MSISAFVRALGMADYRGSPAEREDREAGIKIGGRVRWLVEPELIGTITAIEIDEDGDPWFYLTFDDKSEDDWHKDVRVERSDIAPMSDFQAFLSTIAEMPGLKGD